MNKQQITLYCKKEGWAVSFKNKDEILKRYTWNLLNQCISENYKELKVYYHYQWNYELDKRVVSYVEKKYVYSDYIMRDWKGSPVTASDFPRPVRTRKTIVVKKGFPVEGTGKRKKSKYCYFRNSKLKRSLKDALNNEIYDEVGNKIPPIRVKRKNEIHNQWLEDWDAPYKVMVNKNWKKYRKNQWK